ncbi:TadE/TadG family type IV pilus assembly protein [Occallatibacter savannae]|uniref:TadE/TadG family type IV pilus assembly protein n=1 Tax=Occallatibacter savannae TaxID=1002691 RepID=UPI000D69E2BC|nr:TadE/TadG family type IV pilus assembly protein [Occallatibacter savannae]
MVAHDWIRKFILRPISSLSLHDQFGAGIVEFAIGSAVLFSFLIGVIELCLVFFMYNSTAQVARETCRWASVRGTTCSNPTITACPTTLAQVQSFASGLPGGGAMTVQVWFCNPDGVTNCVQNTSNAKGGNIVKTTASFQFASVPFVSRNALTVSSTSAMVIWQ